MRHLSSCLAAVALFTAFLGCKPAEVPVNGDVFIVTKGRQNVKLGLVDVHFVAEPEMTKFATEKVAAARAEIEKARPTVERLQREQDEAAAKWEEANREFLRHAKALDALRGRTYAWLAYYQKPYKPAADRDTALDLAHKKAQLATLDAKLNARRLSRGDALLRGLPTSVTNAKTDADGKFALKLRPGKYAVVANASRYIGGREKDADNEEYYWIVWVTVQKGQELRLLLSNDNQLESSCAECVFKASAFEPDAPPDKTAAKL